MSDVTHHDFETAVVPRSQFHDQDPHQEIQTRFMEVVEEIFLDATPAAN